MSATKRLGAVQPNQPAPFKQWGVYASEGGWQYFLPEPPSANRWWRNVNGRMVTSKAAREYKAAVALFGAKRKISGPVHVEIRWYRGRKSGDLDKRIGIALDALQGVAYETDAQIVRLTADRLDTDPHWPRIIVYVNPWPSAA